MNKVIKNLSIYIFLICVVTSCKKDYLNVDPVTNYTYYNFMENESQVEQAVVGCYRQLFPIYNGQIWLWGDMLSDNTSFRFNPNDRGGLETERLDEFVAQSGEGTIEATYRESFEGISRSNYILENIDKIQFRSDSVKNIRIGEAKFFRAFHYFNLVRLYGDVSIVLKVIREPDGNSATNMPRRPVAEVYSNVIYPDAIDAVDKLPTTVPTTTQAGRLTKAAARMLLAKAYMTNQRFTDALPVLQAITGYSLHTQYVNNFNPTFKNGVESIFEIQTFPIPASGGGYSFGFMTQWASWGSGAIFWPVSNSRGGLNQPTNDLVNAYETGDVRRTVTIQTATVGTTPNVHCIRKFAYPSTANVGINETQWPVYRFAETLLSIAECLNEASFPNTQAFTLLNQVRTRAGLPNKTQGNANPALAVNSQAAFRLAIEQERRVEFAGEGHRWFDLIRTGRVMPVMQAHGAAEKLLKTTLDPAAYNNIKTLIAIPFREVLQFGYTQNPGW
jgi:starch-binding outer membrane protein, SusD/RagB family